MKVSYLDETREEHFAKGMMLLHLLNSGTVGLSDVDGRIFFGLKLMVESRERQKDKEAKRTMAR